MLDKTKIPMCIGVIIDGNRRWAKEKGLPSFEGHRRGYGKVKECAGWAKEVGVKNLIMYTLSTENWNRSKEEVSYLLDLFRTVLKEELDELVKGNTRVIFAGELSRFPKDLQKMMRESEEKTKSRTEQTLVIAASYGGRAEIVHAANALLKKGKSSVSEKDFSQYLWTAGVPDPDLIIRTGGEQRLSNFLPWQSIYSELFFSPTYWPDFSKEEFFKILEDYQKRSRRMGV
ncbi:di-trans,poly-cis-decaprenylcistransferase [Candidatus Kaiserbacteria bacterium]|nr:di-trans,poly-cis-decaprenylcistransferase [Candidatus Kaiserbacteria bacterium]